MGRTFSQQSFAPVNPLSYSDHWGGLGAFDVFLKKVNMECWRMIYYCMRPSPLLACGRLIDMCTIGTTASYSSMDR